MTAPVFDSIAGPVPCPRGCGEIVWLNMSNREPGQHECEFDVIDVARPGASAEGAQPDG